MEFRNWVGRLGRLHHDCGSPATRPLLLDRDAQVATYWLELIGTAMKSSVVLKIAQRLVVVLAAAWLIDFFVVQRLSDEHFSIGKQIEIVIALLLAWRYCIPLAPGKHAVNE